MLGEAENQFPTPEVNREMHLPQEESDLQILRWEENRIAQNPTE
jgi:hypothetical protein